MSNRKCILLPSKLEIREVRLAECRSLFFRKRIATTLRQRRLAKKSEGKDLYGNYF